MSEVQLSPEAQKIASDLQNPEWVAQVVARTMKRENEFTVAQIQQKRLTGRGPFPVEDHRLGVRTGRLRSAVWASDPQISGTQVTSAIGDNVAYAAIHEFGRRITRPARTGSVRLRTNAAGELLRQPGGRGAIFASKEHKRVKEVQYSSESYEINIPERAPFRTGIGERMQPLGAAISDDLVVAWGERK